MQAGTLDDDCYNSRLIQSGADSKPDVPGLLPDLLPERLRQLKSGLLCKSLRKTSRAPISDFLTFPCVPFVYYHQLIQI